MYETPAFNESNEKILCEMGGKNADMLMTIKVKRMAAGESFTLCSASNETAVLLLKGEAEFLFEGKSEHALRRSPFLDKPYCVHFPRKKAVTVIAKSELRILVQQTDNDRDFDLKWYTPDDCMLQEFGKTQWQGTAHRQVLTVFDYESAPYSNMVLGEVFHKPGCWSSYPPHFHPQPELYYYEFDKPQGFGVGFVGDECFKVLDGGALAITPMQTHQQVAAPGYSMYYVWMIRHLDGDPWRKTRTVAPEHEWLDHAD